MPDLRHRRRLTIFAHCAILAIVPNLTADLVLPPGFEVEIVAAGLEKPTGFAIAPDGRIFVANSNGTVQVVQNGAVLPVPFIDITDEVGSAGHRGLLGIALDPDFANTPWVYLLYAVDPIPGPPDESATTPTFGRLVRYRADPKTGGNTAIPTSRQVLLGQEPAQGFIHCFTTHAVGTLRFAGDGTLFVGSGDGAHFSGPPDAGGLDPECFTPPLFDPIHDIGAFRAQHLGTMAGKILRIDPATGLGLPSNPYWTGHAADVASKVWLYGLRNPFRFNIKPDSGTPETLYIGDVGWTQWEELDVAHGGENFGWPCFEGFEEATAYTAAQPAHSGCDTLETPGNPGPLTPPIITWHHNDPNLSNPPGYTGDVATGGVFYTGTCYPPAYRGAYFYADYLEEWIRVLHVDDNDKLIDTQPFATGADRPTDFATHPVTGDIYYIARHFTNGREIRRIHYPQPLADADQDCDVDLTDFGAFQRCFTGPDGNVTPPCALYDLDGDNDIDLDDFESFQPLVTGPH